MRVIDIFSGLGGWSAAFRDRGHHVTTLDLEPRFGADHVRDLMTVSDLAELGGPFDVVLASPPCECFSVMTIGRNWNKDRTPKTDRAKAALELARHTFDLIERAAPRWYVVENPRGMMRRVVNRPPTATTWYCRWGMPYAKPTDLWTNLNGGNAIGWPYCQNGGPDHEYTPRGDKENSVQGSSAHRERRRRLLAGEDVPGWKLIKSQEPGHKAGHLLTVRTGVKTQRIDVAFGKRRPSGRKNTRYLRDAVTNEYGDRATRAMIPYRLSLAVCLAAERDGRLPAMEEVERIE